MMMRVVMRTLNHHGDMDEDARPHPQGASCRGAFARSTSKRFGIASHDVRTLDQLLERGETSESRWCRIDPAGQIGYSSSSREQVLAIHGDGWGS